MKKQGGRLDDATAAALAATTAHAVSHEQGRSERNRLIPSLSSAKAFLSSLRSKFHHVAIRGTQWLHSKPSSQPQGEGSTPRGSEQTQYDQHYRSPVPPKIEHHDFHGRHELPGSQPASPMEPRSQSAAERELCLIQKRIRKATDGRRIDIDAVIREDGVDAALGSLIAMYQPAVTAEHELGIVEQQIRAARHRLPRNELDAAFKTGGVEGALRLLLASYKPCLEADRELYLVETELGKAAHGILPPNELDAAFKRKATHDAIEFLFKTQKDQLDSLQTSLTTASTRISVLEREKTRLRTQIDELTNAQTQLELKWKEDRDLAAKDAYRTKQRHRAELEEREANYKSEFRRWEEATKAEHRDREVELEGKIKELKDEIEKLKNEFSAKTDEMRKVFEAKEKERHQREMARIEQYRLDNEALKGELVKREHFKGLSDPEIYTNFKKLAGEVDSFSRLPWEKRMEASWPLSDSSLRRSDNPRRLKQYIVQSSIWFILHKMIFRSPFEIFGDEGQRMHHDWTGTFGEDRRLEFPHWPEATEVSEKWRYEQVKECLSAVKKPVNDSDIKKEWKKSHDESLSATANEIYKAVEAVSQVTPNDRQIVQDFVKLAAKFWLEVSSQRCRVLLVFPPHIPNALVRNQKKVAAVLELVVQPELRRMGNAQGHRLDIEQVIKGCEGDHTKFPAR